MKRTVFAAIAAGMAISARAATFTVTSSYDEATGQWIGNVTELTNRLYNCGTWNTVVLQRGVYDVSFMTNSPMGT